MALPSSPISLADINIARGVSSTTRRPMDSLYGFVNSNTSGEISLLSLYGQTDQRYLTRAFNCISGYSKGILAVTCSTVDSSGNLYVAGRYTANEMYNIPNLNDTISDKSLPSTNNNTNDVFVLKYDQAGSCAFGANILQGSGLDTATCLAIDTSNNIWVGGSYVTSSSLNLNNLTGTSSAITLVSTGGISNQPFLIKFDSNGICNAAVNITSGNGTGTGTALCADLSGNVYYCGNYNSASSFSSTNLNGSVGATFGITTTSNSFIIKHNTSGTTLSSSVFLSAATGSDIVNGACVDTNGNIYVCGSYTSSSTTVVRNLNGSNSSISLPIATSGDAYVIKFDNTGTCTAGTSIVAGTGSDSANCITVDSSNNIYVGGAYSSSATVTVKNLGGTNSSIILPITLSSDSYVLRYNISGTCTLGASVLAGTGVDTVLGISVDSTGNVYAVGSYTSTNNVTIRNLSGSNSSNIVPISSGNTDAFLLKFDNTGVCKAAANVVASAGEDQSLAVSSSGSNVYISGSYTSSLVTVNVKHMTGSNSSFNLPYSPNTMGFIGVYNGTNDLISACPMLYMFATISQGFEKNTNLFTTVNDDIMYMITSYRSSSPYTIINSDGTASTVRLQSTLNSDPVLLKYNSLGQCLQGTCIFAASGNDDITAIRNDSIGNIYLGGMYTGTSGTVIKNLDGTNSSNTFLACGGNTDAYIIKYNSNGFCIGGTNIISDVGISGTQYLGIDIYDNVFASGYFTPSNTTTTIKNLDGTNSSVVLSLTSTQCSFLVKYNSNGTCVSGALSVPGTANQGGPIIFDSSNNMYVFGIYQAISPSNSIVANLDGTNSSITLPSTIGGFDLYLTKYNSNGVCIAGGNIIAGTSLDVVLSAFVSKISGDIFMAGYYGSSNSTIIRNMDGTNSSFVLPATSNRISAHITRISSFGNIISSSVIVASETHICMCKRIIEDSLGNLYACGTYRSSNNVNVKNLNGTNSSLTFPASLVAESAFLLKYDSNGTLVMGSPILAGSTSCYCSMDINTYGDIFVNAFGGSSNVFIPKHLNGTSSSFSFSQTNNMIRSYILKY